MIEATKLKAGTVIRVEADLYDVVAAEYHAGGGKMGGAVFVRAKNLKTGHLRELRFRPDERLEDVELERRQLEYLYADGGELCFMNPDTFEQIGLAKEAIGVSEKFLVPNMRVAAQFHEGRLVGVVFPAAVELRVVTAPAPLHEHDVTTYKTVVLENGLEVLAPQFIKEGDLVKIEVATGKYLERVRREGKKV
jgi:elongation factor P